LKRLCNSARSLGNDNGMKRLIIRLGKKVSHACGIKAIRFERRMVHDGVKLRPYRLSDVPVLHALFGREAFIAASGEKNKVFNSWLSLWRWMISTFQIMYIIEAEINGNHQIIGFIGLYNIIIGKSLWLSAAVFKPQDRRRGYGQAALGLLLDSLQRRRIVQMVYGEVFKTNAASLSLCKKLGFTMCGKNKSTFFMERSLKGHHSICIMHRKREKFIDANTTIGLNG
jgi:RimJ/RimL family protein N-acetyltransferase